MSRPHGSQRTGTAVADGSGGILLVWGGSTDTGGSGMAGYLLFRNNVLRAQPTPAQFIDTSVTAGVPYDYTVAAIDNAGNQSGASNAVQITLSTGPAQTAPVDAYSFPEPALRGVARL